MASSSRSSKSSDKSSSRRSGSRASSSQGRRVAPALRSSQSGDRLSYRELNELWLSWHEQARGGAVDRWLKRIGGQKNSVLRRFPEVAQAMYDAQRYLQLSCALETFNHLGGEQDDQDWTSWDLTWDPAHIDQLHIDDMWYWVQLRTQANWQWPKGFMRAESRQTRFNQFRELAKEPLSPAWLLWHGIRPHWLPLLQERQQASDWSNEQLITFIEQQAQPAPVWLRINRQGDVATDLSSIQRELNDERINAQLRNNHICVMGGRSIGQSQLFKAGVIEIQDLASQQITQAVNAKPGDKIWDACAGAGGKTLAIASQMNNKGAVVATDLHDYKLAELKKRAKRAGQLNIRTFTWEGNEPLRLPKEAAQQQGFDKVLVDAPCSSSGTWRRNPDARWRFDEDDTADLNALQTKLLANASAAVRPGGSLIYATCSWQLSENEHIVSAFLEAHPEFTLDRQTILGAPEQDADCMFVAVMRKA